MKIACLNNQTINYHKIKSDNIKNILNKDTVSFSGFIKPVNNNVITAFNLGMELYNNPKIPSNKIIEKYAPDIEIIPVDDTPKEKINDADACIYFQRNENFSPINVKIYSLLHPKNSSKTNRLVYALLTAHEFTHYLQLTSKENQEFMKNISNNDFSYLVTLMPIGDGIFDELDGMKFDFTKKIFNFKDRISELIHSFPLPRKQSFKKEDILASNGMNTDEEFRQYINKEFDRIFDRTIEIILTEEGSADKTIKDFIENISTKKDKLAQFKNNIKKYCAYNAQMEYEAYKTESLVAKKVLNIKGKLNTDSYLTYFSMLENALRA